MEKQKIIKQNIKILKEIHIKNEKQEILIPQDFPKSHIQQLKSNKYIKTRPYLHITPKGYVYMIENELFIQLGHKQANTNTKQLYHAFYINPNKTAKEIATYTNVIPEKIRCFATQHSQNIVATTTRPKTYRLRKHAHDTITSYYKNKNIYK